MHAVILAGGLGTRLGEAAQGLPKPMVAVAGRPFLTHILDFLPQSTQVTLCVGYRNEIIIDYFGNEYKGRKIEYSIEDSPLGTGGAVLKAIRSLKEKDVCIINGDTIFDIPLIDFINGHKESNADITIALKPMEKFDRYGTVVTDESGKIIDFTEKKYTEYGLINGGVYMLRVQSIHSLRLPEICSLEKDLFEKNVNKLKMHGKCYDAFFIDIGVPEDLAKANVLL